jgi:8-oxo-dGTP pyrophosphatase MutT (NUDIX family)
MSFLRHIHSCNNYDPDDFVPLEVDGVGVGRVRPSFARELLAYPEVFTGDPDAGIALACRLSGFAERTAAVAEVIGALARRGVLQAPYGEPYPVTAGERAAAMFVVDRGVAAYFGFRTFGQHLNGFVRRSDGLHMWLARRARDRQLFPGRLDQLVAGGLPWGISLEQNLAKECYEEAGIGHDMAAAAVFVGEVSYFGQTRKGAKPDVLFCYDLELTEGFRPRCTDGEVESFHLMPVDAVMEIVRTTDDFKPNCSLVVLDFLARHGVLDPGHPEYESVVRGLRAAI